MRYATTLQSFVGRTCKVESYMRMKVTRSTLRILFELDKIEGWFWGN